MSAADLDIRPFADPDCFSWRLLHQTDAQSFAREMRRVWEGKVQWGRFTVVSEEFPNPPYPPGFYFEGWSVDPAKMDPPHREAPFNFPLTARNYPA